LCINSVCHLANNISQKVNKRKQQSFRILIRHYHEQLSLTKEQLNNIFSQ